MLKYMHHEKQFLRLHPPIATTRRCDDRFIRAMCFVIDVLIVDNFPTTHALNATDRIMADHFRLADNFFLLFALMFIAIQTFYLSLRNQRDYMRSNVRIDRGSIISLVKRNKVVLLCNNEHFASILKQTRNCSAVISYDLIFDNVGLQVQQQLGYYNFC